MFKFAFGLVIAVLVVSGFIVLQQKLDAVDKDLDAH